MQRTRFEQRLLPSWAVWQTLMLAPPRSSRSLLSLAAIPHAMVDTATISNMTKNVILGTGANFEEQSVHYGNNDAGGSRFAPNNQNENSTACGTSTICRDEGSEETGGVITPDRVTCGVTGGGSGGNHTWYVSAIDSAGNETILGNSGNSSTCHGAPSAYDGSNYETIYWTASPNAASYTVYAANPKAPGSQYAQVASGIVATSYRFNGPYPTSFYNWDQEPLQQGTLPDLPW